MNFSEILLRVVLAIGGAFALYTGFDFAAGGMQSLQLQGEAPTFTITDPAGFYERDSHSRFLGGVWMGVGLVFLSAAGWLQTVKPALIACIGFIFLGGLARFTTPEMHVLFEPAVIGSLTAELMGMPLLYLWVTRTRAA